MESRYKNISKMRNVAFNFQNLKNIFKNVEKN